LSTSTSFSVWTTAFIRKGRKNLGKKKKKEQGKPAWQSLQPFFLKPVVNGRKEEPTTERKKEGRKGEGGEGEAVAHALSNHLFVEYGKEGKKTQKRGEEKEDCFCFAPSIFLAGQPTGGAKKETFSWEGKRKKKMHRDVLSGGPDRQVSLRMTFPSRKKKKEKKRFKGGEEGGGSLLRFC